MLSIATRLASEGTGPPLLASGSNDRDQKPHIAMGLLRFQDRVAFWLQVSRSIARPLGSRRPRGLFSVRLHVCLRTCMIMSMTIEEILQGERRDFKDAELLDSAELAENVTAVVYATESTPINMDGQIMRQIRVAVSFGEHVNSSLIVRSEWRDVS